MILPRPVLSCALLTVVVLMQVTIVERIEIGNASPNLVTLVIVSLALLSNSVEGACYGCFGGLMLSFCAHLTLGPYSMVATIVGYAVGRWSDQLVTEDHPVPPLVAGVFGTLAIEIGRPLVQFLVAPQSATSSGLLSNVAITALISFGLAIPVYVLVQRIVRAFVSVEDAVLVGGDA